MKKIFILLWIAALMACSATDRTQVPRHGTAKALDARIEAKIDSVLALMSVEDKAGQMTQLTLDVLTLPEQQPEKAVFNDTAMRRAVVDYRVGSVLNTVGNRARTRNWWRSALSQLQAAAGETPLKIPVLYGVDAIHGHNYAVGATLFPQQIAQAASWNVDLVEQAASITAYETRATGIPWNFSPVLGLGRDPRWPRMWETFGEDVLATEVFGAAMVRGMQGSDISAPEKVVACAKHYLGYSSPLSGKDRTPAWIPEQQLREYFLPAFRSAIDAGALTVMVNSGEMNGMPVHANSQLLTDLLKNELGFAGFAVTDWQDIEYLHTRHRVASSPKEAVKMAINAGIDMSMVPYNLHFTDMLIELINEGGVPMSRIDDAVRRILRVKFMLGLFDNTASRSDDYAKFGSQEFAKVARTTAQEAITLLKNEGNVLPLAKNTKVLVTGPNANSMRTLNGGWSYSWQGELTEEFTEEFETIYEALQNRLGERCSFVPGVQYKANGRYWEDEIVNIDAAVAAARKADVVVLCVGENSYTEKVGDLEDLYLSDNQTALAKALLATGKPVVLVLNEGRPRIISRFAAETKAIVQAYLPGNFGGEAIADVLTGAVNPSGRLPYTYPRYPNSLVPYHHKYTEEVKNPGETYSAHFDPQFEFGTGLSYTTFEYSQLKLSSPTLSPDGKITVELTLKNTGAMAGKHAVMLFVSDLYASTTPEVKRLRAFQKVELKPGEQKVLSFTLEPKDLAFVNSKLQRIAEAGEFTIQLGNLTANFTLSNDILFD